jgi:ABC-2 type transport system ATP-binding protein
MNTDAAIDVADLRKSYRTGLFHRSFDALKGISFRVERGEVFGLLGPNGAGKTTFIKVLLGIVRKSGGTAALLGRPAGDRTSRIHVGYLPENLKIARHHTAYSALDYYGQLSGVTGQVVRARQRELLERVGLADRAREPVKRYSKGMVQRLGLAQALLHSPDLLILDEPTDGLDPIGRSDVRNILLELKSQGTTVFLNSHLLQEVELVCDRVAILDQGLLRTVGSPEEIAPKRPQGVDLELALIGTESDIRAAIGHRGVSEWEVGENHDIRLHLRLTDQAAVDACIDDLRKHNVSIVGLSRRRVTLEEAFLDILASPLAGEENQPGSLPRDDEQRYEERPETRPHNDQTRDSE